MHLACDAIADRRWSRAPAEPEGSTTHISRHASSSTARCHFSTFRFQCHFLRCWDLGPGNKFYLPTHSVTTAQRYTLLPRTPGNAICTSRSIVPALSVTLTHVLQYDEGGKLNSERAPCAPRCLALPALSRRRASRPIGYKSRHLRSRTAPCRRHASCTCSRTAPSVPQPVEKKNNRHGRDSRVRAPTRRPLEPSRACERAAPVCHQRPSRCPHGASSAGG